MAKAGTRNGTGTHDSPYVLVPSNELLIFVIRKIEWRTQKFGPPTCSKIQGLALPPQIVFFTLCVLFV